MQRTCISTNNPSNFFYGTKFKGVMRQKPAKPRPFWPRQTNIWAPLSWVPINMGTTIVDDHKKTSRDREFLGDPWGDSAEIFRVGRGHSYLQKNLNLFFYVTQFKGVM